MLTVLRDRPGGLDRGRVPSGAAALALMVVALAVVVSSGCSSGFCTVMDCVGQGVAVRLPALEFAASGDGVTVEACVTDRCNETLLSVAALSAGATVTTPVLTEADGSFGRAHVRVTVTDPVDDRVLFDDRARVRLTEVRPNGRRCPPVCLRADEVRFDA
jgi:hypothetical protein